MYIDRAVLSKMTAQDVANIINHYYTTNDKKFFKLVVVDASERETDYWVRPLMSAAPFPLQNVAQIITCETEDGRGISIIVPRHDREFQPATVVFARDASTESAE